MTLTGKAPRSGPRWKLVFNCDEICRSYVIDTHTGKRYLDNRDLVDALNGYDAVMQGLNQQLGVKA